MIPLIALDGIASLASKILDRFVADPQKKADALMELEHMKQTGELAELASDTTLASGQIEVNKIEAASTRLFVSGWRPFVGWVCGSALAFQFILFPLLTGLFSLTIPALATGELITILLGLLGLGGMRTYEKKQGVA